MARDATPEEWAALAAEGRGHHEFFRTGMAAGIAAERARVAAWLRKEAAESHAPDLLVGLADDLADKQLPTATAAHACSYCGRHPDTHAPTGDDRCVACGLGDAREVAP